jgi:hypothetical protein
MDEYLIGEKEIPNGDYKNWWKYKMGKLPRVISIKELIEEGAGGCIVYRPLTDTEKEEECRRLAASERRYQERVRNICKRIDILAGRQLG